MFRGKSYLLLIILLHVLSSTFKPSCNFARQKRLKKYKNQLIVPFYLPTTGKIIVVLIFLAAWKTAGISRVFFNWMSPFKLSALSKLSSGFRLENAGKAQLLKEQLFEFRRWEQSGGRDISTGLERSAASPSSHGACIMWAQVQLVQPNI